MKRRVDLNWQRAKLKLKEENVAQNLAQKSIADLAAQLEGAEQKHNNLLAQIATLKTPAASSNQLGQHVFGTPYPPPRRLAADNNSTGDDMAGETKAERRKTPDRVRWGDLEVGDVVVARDDPKVKWRVTRRYPEELDYRTHLTALVPNVPDTELREGNSLLDKKGFAFDVTGKAVIERVKVGFDSVILADEKKQAIQNAIKQIDHTELIFSEWGFDSVFEKGTAISLLFWGPPGTGKTLTAQAIADQYGYTLKTISTAEIETPEPGGAERNIQKAFQDAGKNTVLLFDECDSLVSSRKFMGSILAAQVNALLTELERFTGIVVFTTNRIETLDEAFDRRLSLKLEFEMPDAAAREKIWQRMFPERAPLAKDVNLTELASVEIAGGHIKNVVLKAARAAANQELPQKDKQITQASLVTALTEEVESSVAFVNAKETDGQFYGTPLRGMGAALTRRKGRVSVDRGQ